MTRKAVLVALAVAAGVVAWRALNVLGDVFEDMENPYPDPLARLTVYAPRNLGRSP